MQFALSINASTRSMCSHWDLQDAMNQVYADLAHLKQNGFVVDIDGNTVGEWSVSLTQDELSKPPYS